MNQDAMRAENFIRHTDGESGAVGYALGTIFQQKQEAPIEANCYNM